MRITMTPTEKPTFFVYEVGRDPEELCLGNLVLKDYANPTLSRHYTHPRIHERDLRTYATITHLTKGWEMKYSSGLNFTPLIPMIDFFKARISWNRKQERALKADEGFRITLKDPEKFLREQVLSEVEAVQALQTWTSGANRGWGSLGKKPKIWMLTGLYLLKDATSTQEKLRTAVGQVGISSTALSPVSGSAIDNSVDLGHSHNSKSQTPTKGLLVWAAQYRALDYHVCKRSAPADIPSFYDDVVSQGSTYYGGGGDEPDWAGGSGG
ncbi:hypothetical protein L207DRAFT_266659 [Hyaloscypha variabilis F]|uniref:Uncharacterized protein n=1 Tax=Hyaloscypha variabilis (strain UAMH 11265 / GT02V1 / F) TaxID=1149755 RepID=A0A2J6RZ97_HYAVF|nr:hypothetical protein L207DRAFT_266659 [Hyaloscypha variabilis F]